MLKELSSNKYYDQMCNTLRKQYFDRIYDIVSNGSELSFDDIIESIKKSIKEDFSIEELYSFVDYIKKYKYATKGNYVKTVLVNKQNGEEVKVEVPFFNGFDKTSIHDICVASPFTPIQNAEKATELMKETIRKYKEENIVEVDDNDMYYIKKGINEIDPELLIDYLIIKNKLEPTSVEELEQFKYMVEFFRDHLNNNITRFEALDPIDDAVQIASLKVQGQDQLDKSYISSPRKMYNWKLKNMKLNLTSYEDLSNILSSFIETEDFKNIDRVDQYLKKRLRISDQISYDYYQQLTKMARVYDRMFEKNPDFTTKKKEELGKLFTQKLVLKNNSVDKE